MTDLSPAIDHIEDVRDEKLDDCPVRPLGHRGGYYYFLSPVGELRVLKATDFTLNGLGSLFEGDDSWMMRHWGRTNSKGDDIGGYQVTDVSYFLMRACRDEGIYDESTPVRGPGVWRNGGYDDRQSGVIVHCGDSLLTNGQWCKAGERIGGAIYAAGPRTPPVSQKAATEADGRFLYETISTGWNFKNPKLDGILVVGFIAQAMLGAAPRWRTHMMVNGEAGSGKSWLADAVAWTLGGAAHPPMNNFTEAGLRQSLTGEARCLVLDEAENTDGGGRVVAVIELIRHMSGRDGSKAVRGSSGGKAAGFSVTGCAYLSSIISVPLSPQDKSRFVCLGLNPLATVHSSQVDALEIAMGRLKQLSPAFRRRMVDLWPNFVATFEAYREALLRKGLSSRNGDTIATLMAGRWVLMNDAPTPHSDHIDEDIDLAAPLIVQVAEDKQDGEGQQCLNHLFSAIVDMIRNGSKQTLGQLVIEEIKLNKPNGQMIAPWGLRWECSSPNKEGRLIIANRSVGLEKIYSGTRWSGGAWVQALSFLGATSTEKTHRFGGAVARGYEIPQEHWPREDE